MRKNLYHLGFPKCGTSSVWQFWSSFPPTESRCLRAENGSIEFDLRKHLNQDNENLLKDGGCYLKFSGAAFAKNSIKETHRIACSYGDPAYLLSVRSPKKVLLSWFHMHKRIAQKGIKLDHFAVKERDKYLAISIEEYAQEFIDKLNHAKFIKRFANVAHASSIWILDFRKVHLGVSGVMGNLLEDLYPGIPYDNTFPRRNVASYSKEEIILPPEVIEQCNRLESDLDDLLSNPEILGPNCRLGA